MTAADSFFPDLGNGKKILLVSGFRDARDKLTEAIEEDRGGAVFGNIWKLATAFALSLALTGLTGPHTIWSCDLDIKIGSVAPNIGTQLGKQRKNAKLSCGIGSRQHKALHNTPTCRRTSGYLNL